MALLASTGWNYPSGLQTVVLPDLNSPAKVDKRSDLYVRPAEAAKEAKREHLRTVSLSYNYLKFPQIMCMAPIEDYIEIVN
jgi:hypothetical protein